MSGVAIASKYPGVTVTTDGTTGGSVRRGLACGRHGRWAREAAQRDVRRDAGGFHAWNRAHRSRTRSTARRPRARPDSATAAEKSCAVTTPVRVESRVDSEQMAETGQEQRGANQQHHRQCDLRDDEPAAEETRRASAGAEPAAFSEHLIDGHSARGHRRHQSDQHATSTETAATNAKVVVSIRTRRHWAGSPRRLDASAAQDRRADARAASHAADRGRHARLR